MSNYENVGFAIYDMELKGFKKALFYRTEEFVEFVNLMFSYRWGTFPEDVEKKGLRTYKEAVEALNFDGYKLVLLQEEACSVLTALSDKDPFAGNLLSKEGSNKVIVAIQLEKFEKEESDSVEKIVENLAILQKKQSDFSPSGS